MAELDWEQDAVGQRVALIKDGLEIGYVEPVGASWQIIHGRVIIAVHSDKASAMFALLKYEREVQKK